MATLLNRTCKECGVKTYEENGFVQCDCTEVDKDAWANGVCETPKDWILPLAIPNKPRIRFVNNGDVSIRLWQGQHTYIDLVILDMRFEDKGFGWFIEECLMEDEYQTEPRYFPALTDAVHNAIEYIRARNETGWEHRIPLIEKFLKINKEL